jgi:cholesterol transport system auxiliary component
VNRQTFRMLCIAATCILIGGCVAGKGEPGALYDFGPLPPANFKAASAMPALVVTDVTGPATMDSQAMLYRLLYADPLQARAYANNRWSGTPLQLLTQRFKSRFAQAGMKVLGVTDAGSGALLLRVEVDDFSHNFDSPAQNHGQLVLRASVFRGHSLVEQRTFSSKALSSSADAAGGARALTTAADEVASNIIEWLGALPPRS